MSLTDDNHALVDPSRQTGDQHRATFLSTCRSTLRNRMPASASPKFSGLAKPVLRWAGSKRLLLPKLLDLSPPNFDRYIEPFCGSACLFLALQPKSAILSDLNLHLVSAYQSIKRNPAEVAASFSAWPATKEGYLDARNSNFPPETALAAARFLFLNRHSFNGVYRENKQGRFNVPYGGKRSGRLPTSEELQLFSKSLEAAEILNSDFETVVARSRRGDFIYLDPPYHYGESRNRGEYGCGAFSEIDIERFIKSIKAADRRGAKILISYNRAHLLKRELNGWKLSYSTVRRSVAGFSSDRANVREYMLRNY